MYRVGTSKREITGHKNGIGFMGYGRDFHIVRDKHTDLHSRAIILDDESGKRICFVVAEICFITISVKRGVVKKLQRFYPELGITNENLMLSAQHTHSGPGGYSHYGFYNLSIPGFVPEVYQAIVNGILESIVVAAKHMQDCVIRYGEGSFEADKDVAFNRSIKAYNANPDVEPLPADQSHLAVDRNMYLMSFETPDGKPITSLNWFGVHTTSMPNTGKRIHFDNKGYAAEFLEKHYFDQGVEDYLGIFAQGTAGDVTPNYVYDRKLGQTRGPFKDADQNAQHCGRMQFEKAREIIQSTQDSLPLSENLDAEIAYYDFSNVVANPEFTQGVQDAETGPACIGVSMLAGTAEGKGMEPPIAFLSRGIITFLKYYEYLRGMLSTEEENQKIHKKYKVQGKKHVIIETGDRKVLATSNVKNLIIPGWVDGGIATFKRHHKEGGLDDKPWTPQVLPLQLIFIGSVALASIPGEITTVAGMRLRQTILKELESVGISTVILVPYTNAYSGYITTYEEYQHQLYEGGHTVFGEWTLAAFQTKYQEFAREMVKHENERNAKKDQRPVEFSPEEIGLRTYVEGTSLRKEKKQRGLRRQKAAKNNPAT